MVIIIHKLCSSFLFQQILGIKFPDLKINLSGDYMAICSEYGFLSRVSASEEKLRATT